MTTKLPDKYMKLALQYVRELKEADEESNWDRRNPDTGEMYCIHGVNLGTWDGPDYMCGFCEEGASLYEYALYSAWASYRRDRMRLGQTVFDKVVFGLFDHETAEELLILFDKDEWLPLLNAASDLNQAARR